MLSIVLLSCVVMLTDDSKQTPARVELKPFENYVGNWQCRWETEPTAENPTRFKGEGTCTAKWALAGQFVEQSWQLAGPDGASGKTIYSYDHKKSLYRKWSFDSSGTCSESTGLWDPTKKTLTWTSRDSDSGDMTTTLVQFPKDGVEIWQVVVKNAGGKVLSHVVGRNDRHEAKP